MRASRSVTSRSSRWAVGAFLLLAACADHADDTTSEEPAENQLLFQSRSAVSLPLAAVPEATTAIAEALLTELRGSEMTPRWTAETKLIGPVYKYRKPEVEGVAYYEFSTTEGGRILISSGTHDSPVPEFSDVGEPLAKALVDKSVGARRLVAQLQRFGQSQLVAVDPRNVVTPLSELAASAGQTLTDYLEAAHRAEEEQVQAAEPGTDTRPLENAAAIEADWAALYEQRNKDIGQPFAVQPSMSLSDVRWVYHSSLLRESINWDQPDTDPRPEVTCFAGCGATAWAQVAAYLAYSERWGNPKYQGSGSTNLFPNISTGYSTAPVQALIKELHPALGSFCWRVNSQSAAPPWNMGNFADWARNKGATVNVQSSWGGTAGGDNEAAWQAIRQGNPVVLGWGVYLHYNVGVGVGLLNGTRYVWVNNGSQNKNYNGWLRFGDTFYTGIVNSFVPGT